VEKPAVPIPDAGEAPEPRLSPHAPGRPKSWRILSTIEWIVAAVITVFALHLHFVFLHHAGALWRDEVSSIGLANLPGFRPLWTMLTHDSFPLLWSLVLRFWETIGLGDTDMHLRWLGFFVGTFLIASIWIAGSLISQRAPFIALALFALSATTVWSGDSLRAYGLGTGLIILAVAFLWRFYKRPTMRNGLMAAALAVLSVQCLYQNAFLLLAAGLSASLLAAIQKKWRTAGWIVALGTIAAISLLPYLPQIARSQDWWMLEKSGFHPGQLWLKASQALGFPLPWFNLVWAGLAALALLLGGAQLLRVRKEEQDANSREITSFAAFSLILGLAGFVLFLKLASLPTQPWYYLPLMGFVAFCIDLVFSGTVWARALFVAFAIATTALNYQAAMPILQNRQTNMDLLAAQLAREAGPNDLIVINNWYCGVTFQRYYHGATAWVTLPPLSDLTIHRYDLMKMEMQNPAALRPVLERVSAALRAGHRIWLIGSIPLDGKPPPTIRPAPNNPWGWLLFPHTQIWAAEFGYFLARHAAAAQPVPITPGINPLENLEMASVSGWRE
jgi:hypothetical protein